MKKLVIICFFVVVATTLFSQIKGYNNCSPLIEGYKHSKEYKSSSEEECSALKCCTHCINHKKICDAWNREYYINVYNQVITLNKDRFININKIKPGDLVFFPPFRVWGNPIGRTAALKVKRNESVWTLVHRYFGENFLFNYDQGNKGIIEYAKKNKIKSETFFTTTLYW